MDGARGGVMQVVSKETGELLAAYELDSLPAFDGMIAVEGRLLISLSDGSIVCMEGE